MPKSLASVLKGWIIVYEEVITEKLVSIYVSVEDFTEKDIMAEVARLRRLGNDVLNIKWVRG